MHQLITRPTRQTGSALIISLTILLVLTILGVSSMQSSSLQERMSGNARDYEMAFQAAEAGIREAELYLDTITNTDDFTNTGGTGGKYLPRGNNPEAWKVEANWAGAVNATYIGANVARNPHYLIQVIDANVGEIEQLQGGTGYDATNTSIEYGVFQVTARGYGNSPNSRVMLQTMYGRVLYR